MLSRAGAAALAGCAMLITSSATSRADDPNSPSSASPSSASQSRAAQSSASPEAAYQRLCSECHGERRYGGYAPPLLPTTLKRKNDETLMRAILDGLASTQMPAFADKLNEDDARAIVALLRRPAGEINWTLDDIAASRIVE